MSESPAAILKSSDLEETSPRYKCRLCGEAFLSLMELRAHRQAYQSIHLRPVVFVKTSPNIISAIEELRDRGYQGYRETDRSS
jgi:hypothetical protein